jgi:small subunit ribosomal protein S1
LSDEKTEVATVQETEAAEAAVEETAVPEPAPATPEPAAEVEAADEAEATPAPETVPTTPEPAAEVEAADEAEATPAAETVPTTPEPAVEVEAAGETEPEAAAESAAEPAAAAEQPAAISADAASTPGSSTEIVVVKMNLNLEDLPDDLSAEEFENAIERTVMQFKEGSIVEGTVVRVDPDEVLIDIGFKSEGHIPAKELSIRNQVNPADEVSVGDTIEAMVLEMEDSEGRMILSKKRAQYERAWGRIEKVMAAGETVKGSVIEVVKGGLIVDIGLRGFLPASLVELRRVRDLQPYIGEEIEAKVIELDKNRNNVVLSRRAYLEEEQAEQRTAFLGDLAEDQIRTGVVSSVVNFGAFVDLGGMDGLVHVSELSWQHVSHPSEVVSVGDEVTVKVLEVDRDRERISLSIRQTREDPWESFSSANEVGDVVEGKVTKTVPFGAFVSVTDGVEGLVHVSEIAMHHVESPELELTVGQAVNVRITEIDDDRRRISLSIKQGMPEWSERSAPQKPQRKARQEPEFEREEIASEGAHFKADESLEAILKELKERGIGGS